MFFGRLSFEGQGATKEHPLLNTATSLGRAPGNDVRLEDPTVSRFHARILSDEQGSRILDLGSGNGTRVNGVELEVKVEYPLVDRALVQIGPFSIRYLAPVANRVGTDGHPAADLEAEPKYLAEQRSQTVVVPLFAPPRLVVTTPQGVTEFPLTGAVMTLGRDPANDIVVDYDAVSRRHARLDRRDTGWEITDLGSTNGLRLHDRQVENARLTDGDVLHVGRAVTLQFRDPQPATSEAALQREPSERHSTSFELPAKGPLILGRSENADVTVFHPQVQRAHAQIVQRAGGMYLQDLGSSAGTYVNGQPIREHQLTEGDVVRIGSSRLVLEHGRLRLVDEAGDLRLDAFHLWRVVGKGLRILQDVSLSIYPQEFVAVVGGSGSGKSTLLNALSGYRPANAGAVLLNGVDLYRNFNAYRNDLGYVPQDDLIHRELPVRRSLDYAARLRMPGDTSAAERQQRIEEVIDELDLRVAADRPVRALSGGQRKRVSIGVELLTRPSLFFLDEATSGLDPGTETQMMKLLRRLADQGRTVALVTHATKNVMICDKVIFLARGGRLAYYGPPEEALRYFQVDDFDEIYGRLEQTDPTESEDRYRQSRQFQENVVKRLNEAQALATSAGAWGPQSASRRRPAPDWIRTRGGRGLGTREPSAGHRSPGPPPDVKLAPVRGAHQTLCRYHLERQKVRRTSPRYRPLPGNARFPPMETPHLRSGEGQRRPSRDHVLHDRHPLPPGGVHHLGEGNSEGRRHLSARAHGRSAGGALCGLQGGCGLGLGRIQRGGLLHFQAAGHRLLLSRCRGNPATVDSNHHRYVRGRDVGSTDLSRGTQ